jgi:hypothetical protein
LIGGDTIFGQLAVMRSKLNLTDEELMNTPWISLKLQMMDYPYYDYKAKDEKFIEGNEAEDHLKKYMK